jgi:hypothetical protein
MGWRCRCREIETEIWRFLGIQGVENRLGSRLFVAEWKYFNLVEPTGMSWRVDLYGVRIPLGKPLNRGFPSMRRTVVRNPENSSCGPIGFLLHNQIHDFAVGLYAGCFLANPEELGSVDIPGGNISPCAHSFVFELHKPRLMRYGTDADGLSVTSLYTGLFVGTDCVVIGSQGCSVEIRK